MRRPTDEPSPPSETSLDRRGAATLTVFGSVWLLLGASGLDGGPRAATTAVAVAGGALLVLWAVRSRQSDVDAPRELPDGWRMSMGRVNAVQAGAIAVVVLSCGLLGVPRLVPSLVCFVVAVHFLPLVTIFAEPFYRWTAAGLSAVAALGLFALVIGPAISRAAVGVGAAACLWTSAVVVRKEDVTTDRGLPHRRTRGA